MPMQGRCTFAEFWAWSRDFGWCQEAEKWASSGVFERDGLSYEEWATRLQIIFRYYELLFSPDLFIIGDGISKKYKKFLPFIDTRAPIVPTELRNSAGIVGAALLAHQEINNWFWRWKSLRWTDENELTDTPGSVWWIQVIFLCPPWQPSIYALTLAWIWLLKCWFIFAHFKIQHRIFAF